MRQALNAQEMLTWEMNHRIKNLFALTESMLRQPLRNSETKEELAEALSGRLRALSSAHSLVLRDVASTVDRLDLHDLMHAIISPHLHAGSALGTQIIVEGEAILCREQAANSLALILNELATNSAKYDSLGSADEKLSFK